MALHAETNDLSVAAIELRATLGTLGIAQHRIARLFGVGPRSVRRWQYGDRRIPCGVGIVLCLLATKTVTIAEVEQAAALVPAWTNGSFKPASPAPLLVEPTHGPTTAEKVFALTPEACRWPYGDPGHPDFHFCGSPVVTKPYCEHHRAVARRL